MNEYTFAVTLVDGNTFDVSNQNFNRTAAMIQILNGYGNNEVIGIVILEEKTGFKN